MVVTTIKIGTAGRGQIPHTVRKKLGVGEGDTLIVEIREVLKNNGSNEHCKEGAIGNE